MNEPFAASKFRLDDSTLGVAFPADAVVRVLLASANRDQDFHDIVEASDPEARRRAKIAFGLGVHNCLGNWLARIEALTAPRVLAHRVSQVALEPIHAPEPVVSGTFNEFGFERLPALVNGRAG